MLAVAAVIASLGYAASRTVLGSGSDGGIGAYGTHGGGVPGVVFGVVDEKTGTWPDLWTDATLYWARPDGSHRRRLGRGVNPLLSPDGATVAFGLWRPGYTNPVLAVMPATGGRPRVVSTRDTIHPVEWAPDSRRLIVSYTVPWGPHSYTETVALVDTRKGTTTRLGPGIFGGGSFSPDGRRIAVSTEQGYVAVYDIRTRRIVRLTHGGAPVWGPAWIAFGRGTGIWLIHGDGSGAHRLARVGADVSPAAWTADGKHLLANSEAGARWVDVGSGRVRALPGLHGVGFGLSRDGSRILDCRGGGPLSNPTPVWLESIPTDGGRPTIIARGSCNASWNA